MTIPHELRRLADAELSLPSRLGYVALMLCALAMTAIVTALWLTEPVLPARTQVAFAGMTLIGMSWVSFTAWVLTHRRTLLARHRIIAGRMAVTFSALFLLGALAVGYTTGGSAPYAAGALGIVFLAGAIVMLVRAQRTFGRLIDRRDALQGEIGKTGQ